MRLADARDHAEVSRLLGDTVDEGAIARALAHPDARVLIGAAPDARQQDQDGRSQRAGLVVRDPAMSGAAQLVAASGVGTTDVVEVARWLGCTTVRRADGGDTVAVPPLGEHTPLELRFLDRAARAASRAIELAGGLSGTDGLSHKSDGSPQVEADRHIDAAAATIFEDLGVEVLSEERLDPEGPMGAWIVIDPVDGTGNYLAGLAPYAFSAGLVGADGEPLAGYVCDLSSGRRWWGATGLGAFRDGTPARPRAGHTLVVPTPPQHQQTTVPAPFRRLRITGCTAIDLCLVADGSAAAWHDLDRAGTHVHDVAGALGVAAAAGTTIRGPDGRPLVLRPDTAHLIRFVVAADDATADALLAAS